MSLDVRTNSALFKRAEQLKRWEESDTNRQSVSPNQKPRKIKFSSGCVFLAACAAGDKEEVLKLLEKGADINTANVDGLTALHQACIDDNFDMVEFLVEHGADVNRGDNEGWTPLHATASCGFMYIAKYLIEKGADVAAVNNDGELAVDIAESQVMEDLLNEEIKKRGIDCESARNEERRIMLRDALEWLSSKNSQIDYPHPKSGATALHVAVAKGYVDVIKILLQCGADIDSQDVDGWTPLHAAVHWGQKEACQLLCDNLADMDAKNCVGQTPFDLADSDMLRFLEELKSKQSKDDVLNRRLAKKRNEDQSRMNEIETPNKVKKIEQTPNITLNNSEMDISLESSDNGTSSETESNSITENVPKHTDSKTEDLNKSNKSMDVKSSSRTDNNEDIKPIWRKQATKHTNLKTPLITTDLNNSYDSGIKPIKSDNSQDNKTDSQKENNDNSNISSKKSPSTSPVSENQTRRSETNKTTNNEVAPSSNNSPSALAAAAGTNRLQIFKNFFKSFVPPVRDEESETQRKAHAKRVRETRRSTQGVTLEEIKSAEQFVKKKSQSNENNGEQNISANGDTANNGINVTATITTGTPTTISRESTEDLSATHERRPSWRLRIDNSSKFKLEDATKLSDPPSTPSYVRRNTQQTNSRPSSVSLEAADTTVTLSLKKPKSAEEKEQDKENDIRNAQATLATQAAIQRRKRPKRRSTGVVSFDSPDDLENEKDITSSLERQETNFNHSQSGSDKSGGKSRLDNVTNLTNDNEPIDYKKLYEQAIAENEQLREKLKKTDAELRDTKQTLEKINTVTNKNSLSELEKRERRAMERKLSEMEEELKHLENLRIENQKLKDENGALIRVISKLSK